MLLDSTSPLLCFHFTLIYNIPSAQTPITCPHSNDTTLFPSLSGHFGFGMRICPNYCRTRVDSDGLTVAKIATKMIAIVRIRYIKYAHYTLYRSFLPIYVIAIIRSLSFSFVDDFEGNANISVAIKFSSTVVRKHCSV